MRSLLTFWFYCFVVCAFSQSADTLQLREVTVYGMPVSKYAIGSKVKAIALSDQIKTLSDGLESEASLYLKNYGNQQLSTVALRGTTASQTAVMWNGINVNSPTLGQTDFSLIPLFLFDELSLHLGTSSSLYGSDAIGGSVIIGHTAPQFTKEFRGTLLQQAGSFGRLNIGMKTTYGNERWEFRTKLHRSFIKNDFPYESPAVGFRKKQSHAAVENYAFDQLIYYQMSEGQLLNGEIMVTDNEREIQPSVTNDQANEILKNRNVRAAINYTNTSSWGILHATTAYQLSDQDYIDDLTSTVKSTQITSQLNIDKLITDRIDLRYGVSYNRYLTSGENFDNIKENRWDAFASFRYVLSDPWILNINLRQAVYDQRYAPFTPTLGTEYFLVRSAHHHVTFRAQVGRGFRVPTLDDRYWIPGGNPDTQAEDAVNTEAGVLWTRTMEGSVFSVDASYYRSRINKMIVWMPENGIWTPTNLQEVHIDGVEVDMNVKRDFLGAVFQGRASYSYTRSLNQEERTSLTPEFNDKQLPYVPVHNARASVGVRNAKLWQLSLRYQFTSLRYTTLDNLRWQSIDAYHLTSMSIGRSLQFEKWAIDITADVNNILDQYYETLKNRAMPGRNFALSLFIKF
jgi:vitamin B12 transporter